MTPSLNPLVRLADTQYLESEVPVIYTRRATLINDATSLTAAGRFSISFALEYERVQLHASTFIADRNGWIELERRRFDFCSASKVLNRVFIAAA